MSRYAMQIQWDDVPHLNEKAKSDLLNSIPPHQRDARTKGIPVLGAGQIYPIAESAVVVDPFVLPDYWPRAYGLDADWNNTAAVWGAWDRDGDVVYLYSEHYQGQQPPSVHADAIKARGEWMAGAMDPSTHGKISPKDGTRLSEEYLGLGLFLVPADNAVEAGIMACYQRLAAGRLKIFRTLRNLITELRIYRRDENGKVIKERDHLMDAMRYLIMTGMMNSSVAPMVDDEMQANYAQRGRSSVTGY
jgi:hypothetical protein